MPSPLALNALTSSPPIPAGIISSVSNTLGKVAANLGLESAAAKIAAAAARPIAAAANSGSLLNGAVNAVEGARIGSLVNGAAGIASRANLYAGAFALGVGIGSYLREATPIGAIADNLVGQLFAFSQPKVNVPDVVPFQGGQSINTEYYVDVNFTLTIYGSGVPRYTKWGAISAITPYKVVNTANNTARLGISITAATTVGNQTRVTVEHDFVAGADVNTTLTINSITLSRVNGTTDTGGNPPATANTGKIAPIANPAIAGLDYGDQFGDAPANVATKPRTIPGSIPVSPLPGDNNIVPFKRKREVPSPPPPDPYTPPDPVRIFPDLLPKETPQKDQGESDQPRKVGLPIPTGLPNKQPQDPNTITGEDGQGRKVIEGRLNTPNSGTGYGVNTLLRPRFTPDPTKTPVTDDGTFGGFVGGVFGGIVADIVAGRIADLLFPLEFNCAEFLACLNNDPNRFENAIVQKFDKCNVDTGRPDFKTESIQVLKGDAAHLVQIFDRIAYFEGLQCDQSEKFYAIPIDTYHANITFQPQISLLFKESIASAKALDRQRVRMELNLRVMNLTATTINAANITALTNAIQTNLPTSYSFQKGKLHYVYNDYQKGYRFRFFSNSLSGTKTLITKLLAIQGDTPDFNKLIVSGFTDKDLNTPGTAIILGQTVTYPERRPTATVTLVRAELKLHGNLPEIILVDRSKIPPTV